MNKYEAAKEAKMIVLDIMEYLHGTQLDHAECFAWYTVAVARYYKRSNINLSKALLSAMFCSCWEIYNDWCIPSTKDVMFNVRNIKRALKGKEFPRYHINNSWDERYYVGYVDTVPFTKADYMDEVVRYVVSRH